MDQEACKTQLDAVEFAKKEGEHTFKRFRRHKFAPMFQLLVFAYNCREHEAKDMLHHSYIAAGAHDDIPGYLQSTIDALENVLTALKAKLPALVEAPVPAEAPKAETVE